MDDNAAENAAKSAYEQSTIRRTSSGRIRTSIDASNPPSDQPQTPPASDDQSLTSFPSLDPSLDNSPDLTKSPIPLSPTSTAPPPTATFRRPSQAAPDFDALFNAAEEQRGRSALFDDTPKVARHVPGTLHLQDDGNVKHLVSRVGAVPLVRQLAADLAQRDAQVTLLQRRAEERESLLKKMLRECEVSNRDIEARLRELERDQRAASDAKNSHASSRRHSDTRIMGTRPEASLDDRMSEALSDDLGSDGTVFLDSFGNESYTNNSGRDTMREAPSRLERNPSSADSKKTSWTDVFKYRPGNTVKPSKSRATLSRATTDEDGTGLGIQSGGLSSDIFRPPPPSNAEDSPEVDPDVTPRRNSAAVDSRTPKPNGGAASWAMRLVGGNIQSQASKDRNQAAVRKQLPATARDSAQAALRRARGGNTSGSTAHRSSVSSFTGPNGTTTRSSPETIRRNTSNILHPSSPPRSLDSASSHLGPVEMDSILPEEDLPPTLLQQYKTTEGSEYLTDKFGFIYDQRRRRRQREAAIALQRGKRGSTIETLDNPRRTLKDAGYQGDDDEISIHSHLSLALSDPRPDTPLSMNEQGDPQPPKRWQDYLKLSSFPTELLSHTPSVAPITSITTAEQPKDPAPDPPTPSPAPISMSSRGSVPSLSVNPAPAATTAVSEHAEIARTSASDATSPAVLPSPDIDPVKSLLDQLTEVHDSLQRDKTVKWNEFLRKVRANRKRRSDTAQNNSENRTKNKVMPEVTMTDGEVIGIAGLGNAGKVGRSKYLEFRNLVLSGIPVSYRAKIWSEGSGAITLRIPGYYDELKGSADLVSESVAQQIDMDITRTLTDNIFFRQGPGVSKLREILLAYAHRNPDVGYCQGMNLITANLLLIMPTSEDAFWILVSMIENILPEKYYDSSLLTSRADQIVLRRYVAELLPSLSTHLENLSIDLELLTFQWFLSVFTDCLSAEALFRVWDVVLCMPDGAIFLFQVALALLKLNEKQLLACEGPADVYGYINQRMTDHAISIDGLIRASDGLRNVVRPDEVSKRRREAVAREEETLRQREAIRKGKMKVVHVDGADTAPQQEQRQSVPLPAKKAVDEIEKGRDGKLKRRSSMEYEEIMDKFGDLEPKTPLLIDDEEALWRA